MSTSIPLPAPQLPAQVKEVLGEFVRTAQDSLGAQLQSVVLYGTAAEGQLRPLSDVNVILVLSAFEQVKIDLLRQPLRFAQAAIQLRTMFLLREEIPAATRWFAPKFADILRRHVVLFGEDPFASISVSREAEIRQLKQQLLNIILRLRSAYATRSLREEQLVSFIASITGPLRSYAATLLALENNPANSPQLAFERLGSELAVPDWDGALAVVATVRAAHLPVPGAAGRVFFQLIEFARRMTARVEALPAEVRREPA